MKSWCRTMRLLLKWESNKPLWIQTI